MTTPVPACDRSRRPRFLRPPSWLAQQAVALRVVVALTLLAGLAYPLAMTALAQLPGLRGSAQGSVLTGPGGRPAGSSLVGQSFADGDGRPIPFYFQARPSHAGTGYDASASGAGNLGPESVVDVLPVKGDPGSGKPSLLTQVCARSKAVGELEGVDGSRPYCTADGVGAVLGVFRTAATAATAATADTPGGGPRPTVTRVVSLNQPCPARPFRTTYQGATVVCARPGADYSAATVVPVRGDASPRPAVPPDAVTASGSGLDPQISPAYARVQTARVARERRMPESAVRALIAEYTTGRALGILGEPAVNVVLLNAALDRTHPVKTHVLKGA
ncbi:potassium-transporting ATPase subunit C [Streptomyces sp. NPDC091292]|uniref:potassium-transporting ATPase subunit C n=1 Tax=Streptomyces sp. NPDC091292 TaxID=3365991 RepID=UPI00381C39FB